MSSQSSAVASLAQWLENRVKTSTNFNTTTTTTYRTLPPDFETEPIKEITKSEPTTKRFTTTHLQTKEEPLIGRENSIVLKKLFVILVTYIVIVSTIIVAYKYLRH